MCSYFIHVNYTVQNEHMRMHKHPQPCAAKIKFDTGEVGVRIVKGDVKRGDIKTGDRAYDHRDLIQLCLTKGGRGVTVFTKDWLEAEEVQGGRGRGRGRGRGGRGRGQGAEDADDVDVAVVET